MNMGTKWDQSGLYIASGKPGSTLAATGVWLLQPNCFQNVGFQRVELSELQGTDCGSLIITSVDWVFVKRQPRVRGAQAWPPEGQARRASPLPPGYNREAQA